MNDPVTNSLALQTEFGDDELKKAVDEHIRKIALDVALGMAHDPQFMDRLIVNNAYMFEKAVARAMKNFMNNPSQIY